MTDFSLADIQWLVSDEAAAWLAETARNVELTKELNRLRKSLSPERAHLILEQRELRKRAREKFFAADQMFFTRVGLEQATDEFVAQYKALRFTKESPIVDLCCGIGGDLLALAGRGPATGVERDEVVAVLAQANVAAQARLEDIDLSAADGCRVLIDDAQAVDVAQFAAWHIDPDRRPRGKRITQVELAEPNDQTIDRMRAANPHGAVKLAPGAEVPPTWSTEAECEWISRGGECRQLVAWFGSLTGQAGQRRATMVGKSSQDVRSIVGMPCDPDVAGEMGQYLFEPDAAVLAADLGGTLAAEHALEALTPGAAYWTGPRPIADAALSCFAVQEVLPLRVKPLKTLLRSRSIGRLEIKKRGVPQDPAALRRELDLKGDNEATLLLTRIGERAIAILAQRVNEPTSGATTCSSA